MQHQQGMPQLPMMGMGGGPIAAGDLSAVAATLAPVLSAPGRAPVATPLHEKMQDPHFSQLMATWPEQLRRYAKRSGDTHTHAKARARIATCVPASELLVVSRFGPDSLPALSAACACCPPHPHLTDCSPQARRRGSAELSEQERWYCPLSCGKYYKTTSTR